MNVYHVWWIAALVLIAAEMIAPGFFLLWIGIAAAVMGVVTWLLPGLGWLGQSILFAVLAVASCMLYWRLLRRERRHDHANARLNRRGEQHIGRRYPLEVAIEGGRGKARVGDSLWLVEGPDLPVGAQVEVVSVAGTTLRVKAVE
ncbi:MAG TPA: NfeD family protein [Rhodanobacteraceae bacterium]|nr:NfeD family protein [Rhodanobacteraceae bacterium]